MTGVQTCALPILVISTVPYTITLNQTSDDTDFTFEANHAYTFVVELPKPGEPIKFTVVDVDGFTTNGNGEFAVQ